MRKKKSQLYNENEEWLGDWGAQQGCILNKRLSQLLWEGSQVNEYFAGLGVPYKMILNALLQKTGVLRSLDTVDFRKQHL